MIPLEKKIFLCDVDGVLNNFYRQLLDKVDSSLTDEQLVKLNNWDFLTDIEPEKQKEAYSILKDESFWVNLVPNELSQLMIEKIRSHRHEVVFCTSPWLGTKGWADVRRKWLINNFNAEGNKDLIITYRKDLCFGHVFIDDKPENVKKWKERWKEFGGEGLLYEAPCNIKSDVWPRIKENDDRKDWVIINEQP